MRSYVYDSQVTQYSISESGEIFNQKTKRTIGGWVNKMGYRCVNCNLNGVKKTLLVHRMLAQTFIPNSDPTKDCVNHKDGNKLNNCISNLEWVSKAENNRHAIETGLNKKKKEVYCFNKDKKFLCMFESLNSAAAMTGFSINSLADNAMAIKKTLCHGYYWNYSDDNTFETYSIRKEHSKPVGRYDLKGSLLEKYSSLTEASDLTHLPRVRISDCAYGKINSYGGFIWKFL